MKLLLAFFGLVLAVNGIAVISVDFGSEWMKIGIVSPGVPLEIALNKESKRKSPVAIAFRDGERTFAEDALTVGVRFPKNCYMYLTDLLGKTLDHPVVKRYQETFPYYDIIAHPERGTVVFRHEDGELYTVEELVGQILGKAREYAETFSQQVPIREVVITVPPYFSQAERRAMLRAASLAELKVLQLINSNTAVALNFGIFRSKELNDTARNFLFYDMGASSTVATVVAYQNAKTKERGYSETNPQLSIVGIGFDRTLGGLEIQKRLRDHLATAFNNMGKTKNDVFKNPRALAKLFKEAGRVKNVLSANAAHYAQIEGLLDDKDFKFQVSRTDLEALSSGLFERLQDPILQALDSAGLTLDSIEQIILVGGNTRMPAVQAKLTDVTKRELSKNINADEACALGAVYRAADLSSGFKVKKFVTKDSVLLPIEIDFERHVDDVEKKGTRTVKRTLYTFLNPYPQKKVLTFNKHTDDFEFFVNYAPADQIKIHLEALNVSRVQVTGVKEAIQKHTLAGAEFKGIKAHFNIDDSGLLNLNSAECTFEKVSILPETETNGTDTVNATATNSTDDKKNSTTKKEKKPEVLILKEELQFVEERKDLVDFDEKTLEEIQKKVKKINEADRIKSEKEIAYNGLESYVLDMQIKVDEDEYAIVSTEEEKEMIRSKCSEIASWLDDEGFEAPTDTLRSKLAEVKEISKDVEFRVAEMKNRYLAVSVLTDALNASSKFLEKIRNATEDEKYLDKEDIDDLAKLITKTELWLNDSIATLDAMVKTENPKISTLAFLEKSNDLDRELRILSSRLQANKARKMREVIEKLKLKSIQPKKKKGKKNSNETITEEPLVEETPESAAEEGKEEGAKGDENVEEKQEGGEKENIESDHEEL